MIDPERERKRQEVYARLVPTAWREVAGQLADKVIELEAEIEQLRKRP